jgi:hypothetical protein
MNDRTWAQACLVPSSKPLEPGQHQCAYLCIRLFLGRLFWCPLRNTALRVAGVLAGPLRSGDTCYLPITAARGGQLFLQAEVSS